MKNLLAALGIVLGCVVATFAALSFLSVPKELAGSASGIFLGAIPYVHKVLERRNKGGVPALDKAQVVSLDGFSLPDIVVAVYGIMIAFAFTQGVGFLAAVTQDLVTGNIAPLRTVAPMLSFIQISLAYLLARWMGIRGGSRGWLLVVLVFALTISVEHASRLLMSSEDFTSEYGMVRTPIFTAVTWVSGVTLYILVGLLGFWRGRRLRMGRYTDYLLRKLPMQTRSAVLEMLRDEVVRLAPARSPATEPDVVKVAAVLG